MTDGLYALALLLALPVAPPVPETAPPPKAVPTGERADPWPQFPPAAVCAEYAAFSAAHADWAWTQHVLYPSERAAERYAVAAEECAFAWTLLARMGGVTDLAVRTGEGRCWAIWLAAETSDVALARLIGEDAFAAGAMPPPTPAWTGPYWGRPQ